MCIVYNMYMTFSLIALHCLLYRDLQWHYACLDTIYLFWFNFSHYIQFVSTKRHIDLLRNKTAKLMTKVYIIRCLNRTQIGNSNHTKIMKYYDK